MTQRRIWNFGDTFTSEKASTLSLALHSPGVYSGYVPVITDPDTFTLGSGFLMLPSGIVVGESSPVELRIYPLPAAATNYTITCRHTDRDLIGGQAALYAVEPGLLTSLTDGVAIAYIRYPGGAVPLAYSHIFPVRPFMESAEDSPFLVPTRILAPFSSRWIVTSLGANTTISDVYLAPRAFAAVVTDGLGPVPPGFETTTVVIPLSATKFKPVSIAFKAQIDPNSVVFVSLNDTDGNAVTLTGSTLLPSPTFSDFLVSVNSGSGVFTPGDSYTLMLSFKTPSLDEVNLQSIVINYDPLP